MKYLSLLSIAVVTTFSTNLNALHRPIRRVAQYVSSANAVEQQINRLPIAQKYKAELVSLSTNSDAKHHMNRIKFILSFPWNTYAQEKLCLTEVKQKLDASHYGMESVKDRILDFVAVRKLSKGKSRSAPSPVLCLAGPPGIGKTAICKAVAEGIHRPFASISLSGAHDEGVIRGHESVYTGSSAGRIIKAISTAKVMNPVILLDEIDKTGASNKGSIENALLELLDPSQNKEFVDHYMGIPVDLSQVLFIATANYLKNISEPLKDRMEVIELDGYSVEEKIEITQRYMLKQFAAEMGLDSPPALSREIIREIITQYTQEPGVRNLSRAIKILCAKKARALVEGTSVPPFDSKALQRYLSHTNAVSENKKFGF